MSEPDLLIVWGPRSLVSLLGVVLIIVGVWNTDRQWDEKGSAAYHKAAAAKKTTTKKPDTASTPLKPSEEVEIPKDELDDAFAFPWAFLLGWTLFGLSYFSPLDGTSGFVVTPFNVAASLLCLAIGWIASVPMGDAVRYRNGRKKTQLGMLFVLSWVGLVTVSGWDSEELTSTSTVFRALGAISIVASMKILWKFRKMGDTWEQSGKPNPNPIVYNLGGPLFVFGWFLFWTGMTAVAVEEADSEASGLPLYFTTRSAVAFAAGCGMVPIVMMVDYAHDEGAEFTGTFGTDGRFFGRFLESPIPFVAAWTAFGAASFLNIGGDSIGVRQYVILANCILQGIDAGILIQTALYQGDMAGKTRYSIPFVLLFLALAVEIAWGSYKRLALSLPGAMLIIVGQKTVFGDRKRGDYWMETGEVNPNPIVYSYGELFFMTGWILFSVAMAIPAV